MSKNKSLIVVDMQEQFLGVDSEFPDFYYPRRLELIQRVSEKVESAISRGQMVLNITFGDTPIVSELQELLTASVVRQFRKKSDCIFIDSEFRTILDGDTLRRKLIKSDKNEFNNIYPKKKKSGFPIKELFSRGGSCDIVGVSTVECVLAVNLDLVYIRDRIRSDIHFKVLGDYCMTSHPQSYGRELSQGSIDELYKYYRLPLPIWDNEDY